LGARPRQTGLSRQHPTRFALNPGQQSINEHAGRRALLGPPKRWRDKVLQTLECKAPIRNSASPLRNSHNQIPLCESTVRQQRETNIHIRDGFARSVYVALRDARDATLPLPDLMLAALQINIRGGRLPEPEANGQRYL